MNRYKRVDRGAGSRAGQLLQHIEDPKRWQIRAFIGRDAKGRKQYRSKVIHGLKKDAHAALIEMLQSKNHGHLTPRGNVRFAELVHEWLGHKSREVEPRTLQGYQDALERYVLPTLGHRRLEDITLHDIDTLYGAMSAGTLPKPETDDEGNAAGWQGKPLSPRTIRLTHAAVSQALSQAVRWGMIPFNPAAEATLPAGKPREKRAMTLGESTAFIAASESAFYRTFYRVLLGTGMRPGEACALRWKDLDFEGERISILRAATRGEDGKRIESHPKTAKSRRTIPMFTLRDELLAHQKWQAEHGLDGPGLVFTNQDGGALSPWAFNKRELHRIAKTARIGWPVTLYTFRHTFATLHLQLGTPLKVVSEWLGHSTIQQTANTYQHLSSEVSMDYAAQFVLRLADAQREVNSGAPAN